MSFTGKENFKVQESYAAALTLEFRNTFGDQPLAAYFSASSLSEIIGQERMVGIRFYFGYKGDKLQLVACGVDEDQNDNLSIIIAEGRLCPPFCGESNSLNSNK